MAAAPRTMTVRLRAVFSGHETERQVELSADGIGRVAGGPSVVFDRLDSESLRVVVQGRPVTVFLERAPDDTIWVFAEGVVWTAAPGAAAPRRARPPHHETLTAPMPATVVKVLVTLGAQVRKGDTVAVLEAMKMELPIRATRDGTVSAIDCAEGDLVQPGVALVEID
jgi:biotin carboxyl carrier protein